LFDRVALLSRVRFSSLSSLLPPPSLLPLIFSPSVPLSPLSLPLFL
jgi:hypothetical protein